MAIGVEGTVPDMFMRICVLTSVHPPFDVRIFHRECRSLSQAGYDVTLIAPHDHDEIVDGICVKAIPRPRSRIARMIKTAWQVYREGVRLDADVYHFHDPELIPIGLLLRARGKKVVYDIHEDVPRDILTKFYLPRWLRQPLGWFVECIENSSSRWFSALIPATPDLALRFAALNENGVLVQNFPILDELAGHEIAWSQRVGSIAYVGTITANRGIRQMVDAVELLPERLKATIELAGTFSPASLREEMLHQPGWKRVKELGYLDRAGVKALLGRACAGLVPLHPDGSFLRSQPIKLFEYMSAGIPVIASDFPLWRRIIEGARCGVLVNSLDAKALAEAMEYVLTHPQEAEAMGRRGRAAVEKGYSWESEERKLLQLYADLMRPICAG